MSSTSRNPVWIEFAPEFIRRRLEGRSTLHAIIHNAGWLLGDKALRLGLGLLVGAWVTRYLGPSQYGELSYVLALVAFFDAVSRLGLEAIAIREMSADRNAAPAILGTVFRLRLLSGFLCWLAVTGSTLLFGSEPKTVALTTIVAGGLVFQAADTVELWFQSQMQSKRTVIAKTVAYLLTNSIRVLLVMAKAELVWFAIAGVVEIVLSAFAFAVSYRKYPAPLPWRWSGERGRILLKEAWPYMLSALAIMIYMRIDQVMLHAMLGSRELGIFSAAMPLSMSWYFIPMMIAQSAGPSIAVKKKADPQGYERAIDRLFAMMWLIMLPISLAVAVCSVPLVRLMYGEAYDASAHVLAVHVFANVPIALGVVQGIWIVNERKNTLLLTKTMAGAVVNVVLNQLLIPEYGALGAAAATLAGQSVSSVLSNALLAPRIFRGQIGSWLRTR